MVRCAMVWYGMELKFPDTEMINLGWLERLFYYLLFSYPNSPIFINTRGVHHRDRSIDPVWLNYAAAVYNSERELKEAGWKS